MRSKMGGNMEDYNRRELLIISAVVLGVALCVSIIWKNNPWLTLWAFLLPLAQNGLALFYLDHLRRCPITQIISFSLSIFTFVLAALVGADADVFLFVACVYIVWGGMFQMALLTLFEVPQLYGALAVMFALQMSEQRYEMSWIFLCIVPLFLTLLMLFLKHVCHKPNADDTSQETAMVPV